MEIKGTEIELNETRQKCELSAWDLQDSYERQEGDQRLFVSYIYTWEKKDVDESDFAYENSGLSGFLEKGPSF